MMLTGKVGIFLMLCICIITQVEEISFEYPSHFPPTVYDFDSKPLSKQKIKLGRALFYDPILSKDGTISCASCHSPYNGFAHTDHALSHGINDEVGIRNAPGLFNLAWQKNFMWDGAIHDLEVQALNPITSEIEMGEDLDALILKLESSTIYPTLFYEAFGDSVISTPGILKSLAQFQLTLTSFDSKYDRVISGRDSFSTMEQKGHDLFMEKCNTCHEAPLFTNRSFESNNLPLDQNINDLGRSKVTLDSSDRLKFKVPSLRNISYTYPYMHDGRFKNLRTALNHYKDLDLPHRNEAIELSSDEVTELMSFLLCLDDESFIFDPTNKFPRHILLSQTN